MNKFFRNIIILFILNVFVLGVFAQEQSTNLNESSPNLWEQVNIIDKFLLLIAVCLMIPIYYVSRIFNWSLKHYLRKKFENKTFNTIVWLALLTLPSMLYSQNADTSVISQFDEFNFLRWFLLVIILLEVFILGFFGYMLYNQFKLFEGINTEIISDSNGNWISKWWKKVNNFGPIEDELKIDTGHNYDGIRELDNNIPIWFSASFIISIVFAVVYFWRYHVAEVSPLMAEEFQIEMDEAELAHQNYLKSSGSAIDENNITFPIEESDLAEGQKLYIANCSSCHLADGGGQAGPNLTDNNWINGCTPKDIYQSIKYGRKNGMMAWKDNFNDHQILQISSFVRSLQGTKPTVSKPAEGDICKTDQ